MQILCKLSHVCSLRVWKEGCRKSNGGDMARIKALILISKCCFCTVMSMSCDGHVHQVRSLCLRGNVGRPKYLDQLSSYWSFCVYVCVFVCMRVRVLLCSCLTLILALPGRGRRERRNCAQPDPAHHQRLRASLLHRSQAISGCAH